MRMSAKEIIGWEIIICKQNLWNGGDLEMHKTDNILNMQITIVNSMKQEWDIDFCEVSALLWMLWRRLSDSEEFVSWNNI